MNEHLNKTRLGRRRSGRSRRPLVIDGHSRRLDESSPRNRIFGSGGFWHIGASHWSKSHHTLQGDIGRPTTFFGRRPEPEVDLFRHEDGRSRVEEDESDTPPPSSLPLMIACIAGAAMAALFILPNLFDLASGSAARISISESDASLGNGIGVSNLKADLSAREGTSVLTLTGEVSNAANDQTVPPIEIVLTDGEGGRIVRRIEVTHDALRNGDSLGFSSSVLLPDAMRGRLELSLRPAASTGGRP